MEIVLYDVRGFPVAERFSFGDTFLKIKITEGSWRSRNVKETPKTEEYRNKLVTASTDFERKTGRSLCIHLKKNPADPDDIHKCMVRVHGFLWDNLESLWIDGLKLRLQLCCSVISPYLSADYYPPQLFTEMLIADSRLSKPQDIDTLSETCLKNQLFSETEDVTFYRQYLFGSNYPHNPNIKGNVTITLLADDDSLHMRAITGEILNSKIHCDLTIVAKNGSRFACNKNFLAAHSPVFTAMLSTDMKESKTNLIEMKDMTPEGVKALLLYMYGFGLEEPMKRCEIALELLKASHKYAIKSLEERVCFIFKFKGAGWINDDTAVNGFLFVKNVESFKEVAEKIAFLLLPKPEKFVQCVAFKHVLKENPQQAVNAVEKFFLLTIKQADWFNAETAFENFISKNDQEKQVMFKEVAVLVCNFEEFRVSTKYQAEFNNNPSLLAEGVTKLFSIALKQNVSLNVNKAFDNFLSAKDENNKDKMLATSAVLMAKPDEFLNSKTYKTMYKKQLSKIVDTFETLFCLIHGK